MLIKFFALPIMAGRGERYSNCVWGGGGKSSTYNERTSYKRVREMPNKILFLINTFVKKNRHLFYAAMYLKNAKVNTVSVIFVKLFYTISS